MEVVAAAEPTVVCKPVAFYWFDRNNSQVESDEARGWVRLETQLQQLNISSSDLGQEITDIV